MITGFLPQEPNVEAACDRLNAEHAAAKRVAAHPELLRDAALRDAALRDAAQLERERESAERAKLDRERREKDARIAVDLFGFRWLRDKVSDSVLLTNIPDDYDADSYEDVTGREGQYRQFTDGLRFCPCYCVDPAAMLQIIDKMKKEHGVSVEIFGGYTCYLSGDDGMFVLDAEGEPFKVERYASRFKSVTKGHPSASIAVTMTEAVVDAALAYLDHAKLREQRHDEPFPILGRRGKA